MNILKKTTLILCLLFAFSSIGSSAPSIRVTVEQPVFPVLTLKEINPVLKLTVLKQGYKESKIEKVQLSLNGTTNLNDIENVGFYHANKQGGIDENQLISHTSKISKEFISPLNVHVLNDTTIIWVSVKLKKKIDLQNRIQLSVSELVSDKGKIKTEILSQVDKGLRVGVALRKHNDDGVHTYRIPGLATSRKGTLLAIYDVRRESSRDLQGNIDIGLNRSFDGGISWEPLQIVMDRGTWGYLPEKFNGISDACILVDQRTDDIYIAGEWMYGVLDDQGKWVEGLTESSKEWNHQWRQKGSQPGLDVKETSQFLIVKSTDDGHSWSQPVNLTKMCKKEEWWLWAPAPGCGITMENGVLVMPTQGRDKEGKPFSNITWSKDKGRTWTTSSPAIETPLGTTECAVVQLSDGSLMLNMRDNRNNKDNSDSNGRTIAVTNDLGETWKEHTTSCGTLIEPTCMASLHKHVYTENGKKKSILVFSNPNSKNARNNITIKISFDDGQTWPEKYWMLLDEGWGRGYSCLTSVDEQHIGILYEGSQADMIFQKISLRELISM